MNKVQRNSIKNKMYLNNRKMKNYARLGRAYLPWVRFSPKYWIIWLTFYTDNPSTAPLGAGLQLNE